MSSIVDLTKKVAVVLEKRNLSTDIKAQVGFAIDISGSMQGMYSDGTMQTVVNRIQALANRFDDNQTLDMWAFHTQGFVLEPAVPSMFGSYVKTHVLNHPDLWGGTNFAPVLHMITSHYFGGNILKIAAGFLGGLFSKDIKENTPTLTLPVYLLFLTDGDDGNITETRELIKGMARDNIYIQFVGIGHGSNFKFPKGLADEFGHVGFCDFSDISKVTDEQMFESLLSEEFVSWIKGK